MTPGVDGPRIMMGEGEIWNVTFDVVEHASKNLAIESLVTLRSFEECSSLYAPSSGGSYPPPKTVHL